MQVKSESPEKSFPPNNFGIDLRKFCEVFSVPYPISIADYESSLVGICRQYIKTFCKINGSTISFWRVDGTKKFLGLASVKIHETENCEVIEISYSIIDAYYLQKECNENPVKNYVEENDFFEFFLINRKLFYTYVIPLLINNGIKLSRG
jgi:hypothetical protein